MRQFSLACALVAIGAPALALDGLYRPDFDWAAEWDCKAVGMDGGAVELRGTEFIGVENFCELTNPVTVRGMGATLYDAVCDAEGMQETRRMMVHRTFQGMAILTDGVAANFVRCE